MTILIRYGGLAQSEECVVCNDEAAGSKPAFSMDWSYSVMVITVDFESTNPGSNPGRTFFLHHGKNIVGIMVDFSIT